jgi:hypothetical protein
MVENQIGELRWSIQPGERLRLQKVFSRKGARVVQAETDQKSIVLFPFQGWRIVESPSSYGEQAVAKLEMRANGISLRDLPKNQES